MIFVWKLKFKTFEFILILKPSFIVYNYNDELTF
jgi:hypothetical protein